MKDYRSFKALFFGLAILLTGVPVAQSAIVLIHDYEFGSLNDALGGPALVSGGGILDSEGYHFSDGEGLTLSNWVVSSFDSEDYTLDFSLKITDEVSTYSKIVDASGLTSDFGLYRIADPKNQLSWYDGGPDVGFANEFPINQYVRIDITRDRNSNLITGYINGVQQFVMDDTAGNGIFGAADNMIALFQDDNGFGENPIGVVNQFRIYSGAMTALEVAGLGGPKLVPEPASAILLMSASAMLGLRRRRSV